MSYPSSTETAAQSSARPLTSTSCDVPLRSCERRSRSSRPRIGSAYAWPPPNRMSLGGEDHLPEVERLRRGEQQEEIFQRLREAEAVHVVGPLLRHGLPVPASASA